MSERRVASTRWAHPEDVHLLTLDPHEQYFERVRLIRWRDCMFVRGERAANEAYGYIPKIAVYSDGTRELL
jgi:hypothetical protein